MNNKKTVYLGLFLALAMILSYVEHLIPFYFGVPGLKLGLANALCVILLFFYTAKDAFIVNVLRIVLSGFLFGNAFSIVYSLAGAVLSFIIMLLCKKSEKINIITASILGAVFHNIGQLIIACIVMETGYMIYYMPVLLLGGFITGLIIGIIAKETNKRLPKDLWEK